MKKIFSLYFLLIFICSFAQIKWLTIEEVLTAQQSEPRKILILFHSKNKVMGESDVMSNSVIMDYISKYFYAVKFDVEYSKSITYLGQIFEGTNNTQKVHSFTRFMNVSTVPSFVFINENLNIITAINGTLSARDLEPYLDVISSNRYLKFKSSLEWSNFQNKFKGKVKN